MSEGPEGGPLQGLRVLDLSRLVPGPACSWYLAGHGAEVWRVEPPGGDPLRHLGPFDADGTGAWFAWAHRGKRSVVADLRTAAGRALVRALAARVDVLLESHRPGVMASMGLDPAILVAEESTLIVASLTAYGQHGDWAHAPGHDLDFLAWAGALHAGEGLPAVHPVQVADWFGGAQNAALRISLALLERARTGRGQWLDLSMTEATLPLGLGRVDDGSLLGGGLPTYRCYVCADGGVVAVAALEPKFRAALESTLGVDASDAEALAAAFLTRPRDAWVEVLAQACVAPVLSPAEARRHPHHLQRGSLDAQGWPRVSGAPARTITAASRVPPLGEANDTLVPAVLAEAPRRATWFERTPR